jgi:acyl-coenzyme A thioesterase PaaI-like protein
VSVEERSQPRATDALYRCHGDPGSSDWVRWSVDNRSRFNGQFGDLLSRRDGNTAIIRLQPHIGLGNVAGSIHGGAVMTFVDIAMFLGTKVLGRWSAASGGLTVDCNVQFVGGADLERPVDALVQITRETGRFMFVRGTVEQADDMISSFLGILRKPSR